MKITNVIILRLGIIRMNNIERNLVEIFDRCSLIDYREQSFEEITQLVESQSGEMDSFVYMSTLVEIESEFEIEIPDVYLSSNLFASMDNLVNLIQEMVGNK